MPDGVYAQTRRPSEKVQDHSQRGACGFPSVYPFPVLAKAVLGGCLLGKSQVQVPEADPFLRANANLNSILELAGRLL